MKVLLTVLLILFSHQAQADVLKILCWEGYATEDHQTAFKALVKEKYGVDLEIEVTLVADSDAFYKAVRDGEADLIVPAHNIPKSPRWPMIEKEYILPIDLDNIPNYKKLFPYFTDDFDYLTHDDKVYGVPFVFGLYGLAYNTNLVDTPPESWQVLWDPQYADKYTVSLDYHEMNMYITALASGYRNGDIFNARLLFQDKVFLKNLKSLAKNANRFWGGVDSADELKGLSIATAWGFAFDKLAQEGEVWQFATPEEGVTGGVDVWSIGYSLRHKPQMKRIAEEWINYTLDVNRQVAYARALGQSPVNRDVVDVLSSEEVQRLSLDKILFMKDNVFMWNVLSLDSINMFRFMWGEALPDDVKPKPDSMNILLEYSGSR